MATPKRGKSWQSTWRERSQRARGRFGRTLVEERRGACWGINRSKKADFYSILVDEPTFLTFYFNLVNCFVGVTN